MCESADRVSCRLTCLAIVIVGGSSGFGRAAGPPNVLLRRHEGRDFMGYAMRTRRYRYVEWLDATTGKLVAWELYDHTIDPDENEKRADQSAAVVAELHDQMWRELPPPPIPFPFVKLAAEN